MRPEQRKGTVIPIVLAAGASSRMGRPKALLPVGGTTVLGRVLAACRGLGRPVVVTAPADDALRQCATDLGAQVAVNPWPEHGQISSLQEGLGWLDPEAVGFLIFPVDFPLVLAQDITALLERFERRATDERIFVPSFERRRGHPLLVEAGLAGAYLAVAPGGSARDVMTAHAGAIVHVEVTSDRVLVDMDTPADHARCQERSNKSDLC